MHAPPAPAPQLAPVDEEKMEDYIRIIIQTVTTDRISNFQKNISAKHVDDSHLSYPIYINLSLSLSLKISIFVPITGSRDPQEATDVVDGLELSGWVLGFWTPQNRSILQRLGHPNLERNLGVVVSHIFLIFTPKIGEDELILTSIFFRWVEITNQKCFIQDGEFMPFYMSRRRPEPLASLALDLQSHLTATTSYESSLVTVVINQNYKTIILNTQFLELEFENNLLGYKHLHSILGSPPMHG